MEALCFKEFLSWALCSFSPVEYALCRYVLCRAGEIVVERCFVSSWDAEILCMMALGPPCKKFAFKNCYFQKRLLACFFPSADLGSKPWRAELARIGLCVFGGGDVFAPGLQIRLRFGAVSPELLCAAHCAPSELVCCAGVKLLIPAVWKCFTVFNLISENFLIPLFGQFWGRSGCFHLGFMIYTLFLRYVCSGGEFFITFLCSDCFVLSWDKLGSFEGPHAYVQNIGRLLSLKNAVETVVHPVLWFLQIPEYWSWGGVSGFTLLTLSAWLLVCNFYLHEAH